MRTLVDFWLKKYEKDAVSAISRDVRCRATRAGGLTKEGRDRARNYGLAQDLELFTIQTLLLLLEVKYFVYSAQGYPLNGIN